MAIETVSESQRMANNAEALNKRTPKSDMDKDDFLKLLCVQMQNQDPMNPMEDMDFISQMSSFSSLEQMLNLNKTVEGITSMLTANKTSQAMMYLGTNVVASETDESGEPVAGTVSMVGFKDGEPYLKVGDYALSLDQIKLASY